MRGTAQQKSPESGHPLSIRAIVIAGALLCAVGAVAVAALLNLYGSGTNQDRASLDVVRTAGTLVVGTGGAAALLLAARRQRSTELTLEHQREVAVEQRITELYTLAVDQIGNAQAPVRLGGFLALERLAQDNPGQRQTVVDVICAYLRMPYALPDDEPNEGVSAVKDTPYEQLRQELQVRMTAQRILTAHLRYDAKEFFWPYMDVDLSEAQLYQLDLTRCWIRRAEFGGAHFAADARFGEARFSGPARFERARFSGHYAWFVRAKFSDANFDGVQFSGDARFDGATFREPTSFDDAQFVEGAHFGGAEFLQDTTFTAAQFSGAASFADGQFFRHARFGEAKFSEDADFDGAQFSWDARFSGAQFSSEVHFYGARARYRNRDSSWPSTWTTREAGEGDEKGWLYLCVGEVP